jgi:small-conductance mechanosensitive channel
MMSITTAYFRDSLAAPVNGLVSHWLTRLFGPAVNKSIIGPLTWADIAIVLGFVIVILLIHGGTAYFIHRRNRRAAEKPDASGWRPAFLNAIGKPLYVLIWVCGIYLISALVLARFGLAHREDIARRVLDRTFDVLACATLFWGFLRVTGVLDLTLRSWAHKSESRIGEVLAPLAGKTVRVLVPLLVVVSILPIINLPSRYAIVLARASSILIILTVSWIVSQAVHFGERTLLSRYDIRARDNLHARKLYTQTKVLSRTIYFLIAILTAASILMLFDQVRRFGTSLLASAGVAGVIIGFAAQRTIANLFAGFQLAITQPIRLDDVIVVDHEWGRVEQITLTYVVVRIWDERRLIVPLSYFIEKPFQNWTRTSSSLLGAVTIPVDYSLPLDAAREATRQIVESSPLWDKRFWNLQVTDATDRTMQLRVLATSDDSSKSWDLRCEIREKLIEFIQKNYPQSLPQLRRRELNPDHETTFDGDREGSVAAERHPGKP